MNFYRLLVAFSFLSLLVPSFSFCETQTKAATSRKLSTKAQVLRKFPSLADTGFDAKALERTVQKHKGARRMATIGGDLTEDDLSPAFKEYRDRFLKIADAESLAQFMNDLDKN